MNIQPIDTPPRDRAQAGPQPRVFDDIRSAVDLSQFLRALSARRWTIIGTVAVGVAIALLIAFQITPLYAASTQILIGGRENRVIDAESVLAGLTTDTSTLENQVQILLSRNFAERVTRKLGLQNDPEFNSKIGGGGSIFSWLLGSDPQPAAEQTDEIPAATIDRVLQRMSVGIQGRSSVMTVSFMSRSRERAAEITNTIADLYIVDQLEAKFDAAERASSWLNERLAILADTLRTSEVVLETYKAEHGLSGQNGDDLLAQQISTLNGQLVLARSERAEKETKYALAQQVYRTGGGLDAIAEVLNSGLISGLRSTQAELMRKEAELATRYGERHPEMIAVRDERRQLEAKIREEVRRVIENMGNEAAVARAKEQSLQQSLDALQGQSDTQGQARIKLRELQRDAESNKQLYETFLERFKESRDSGEIQTPDARIISAAVVPNSPSYPNKILIVSVAFMGSLMLGVLAALLLESLDNGFRTAQQIERQLQIPNLGLVPFADKKQNAGSPSDLILDKPLSAFSEAIRSLLTAIQLSSVDSTPKVIVVTSAVPNEGKTTIAVSLARLSARAGQRTILIDCDMRHPSVGKHLSDAEISKGVVEVLSGRTPLAEAVVRDPKSTLDILPVGAKPPNPADIVGSASMRSLIATLRTHYDMVIIDSAPILPVSDTRVLASLADKTLFVVRWDQTPRDACANAVKLLMESNADICGACLTQVDLRRHALYGYGYTGYYNKSAYYYSHYYTE